MSQPKMPTADETGVQVSIAPGKEVNSDEARTDAGIPVMIEIARASRTRGSRTPTDICCVVDVSGSMGSEAMLKAESGEMSGHGLSVLDVVKHALKSFIHTLAEGDRLALVSYSTDATKILALTDMTSNGRTAAENCLNQLVPAGMTNLWDGLKTAFEVLQTGQRPGRFQHVVLFTDGLPNINPPRGIVPMLKRLKEKEGGHLPVTLSTFGFGYELDGELLSSLAIEGNGAYNYIPDAGLVGTIFVHALANLLVVIGKDAIVTLEATNGASFVGDQPSLGGHLVVKKDANSITLSVGMLQNGQPKNLVVQMKFPAGATPGGQYLKTKLEFISRAPEKITVEASGPAKFSTDFTIAVERQRVRLRFVDTLRAILQKAKLTSMEKAQGKALPLPECLQMLKAFRQEIVTGPAAEDAVVKAFLEDIDGQVTEAMCKEDFYTKWGILFIPSLMFAHLNQQCNNFRDAGVQHYGEDGELFQEIRDAADEIFVSLPAPVPSAVRPPAATPAATPTRPMAMPVITMAAFHDRFAGCFDGTCCVQRADGSSFKVQDVRRGDVLVGTSGHSKVLCVVRTAVEGGTLHLVELEGGLKVTAYHPVLSAGEWRFPVDLASEKKVTSDAIYTFVLERGGSDVLVNGTACVTLGHGLETGAAKHPFFGDWEAVIQDLEKVPGFADGLVDLKASSVQRDPETGLVCSLAGTVA